jgi:hypothetical protein
LSGLLCEGSSLNQTADGKCYQFLFLKSYQ